MDSGVVMECIILQSVPAHVCKLDGQNIRNIDINSF